MILDLHEWTPETPLECDFCIIGSGAAGLAIANEMCDSRFRVVVLEAGGEDLELSSQEPYRTVVSGLPFSGGEAGRFRVFGGSTTRWGGQSLPLSPLDFEKRDWVANSGWPLSFEDVAPYYHRAAAFLSTDQLNFDTDLLARFAIRPPALDPSVLRYHFSKWSPTPNLAQAYRNRLRESQNVRVILHANLTGITLQEPLNSVESVRFTTLGGKSAELRARSFVLCCGGIETARILLANRSQARDGIGNGNDLVGRFFQDHPSARLGTLTPADTDEVQRLFNLFHQNGRKYSVRLSATPEFQRSQRVLNATSSLMFEVPESSAAHALRMAYQQVQKREFGAALAANLVRCLARPQDLARPVYRYYVRGRTYLPNPAIRVMINVEQEPDPESRVTLSEESDGLGIPRPRIHWALSDLCGRTVERFALELRNQLKLSGMGDLALEPWVSYGEWRANLADQYHHIGTTRMGETARQGVVDPACQVHGVDNLFIGSSSVFPTGGHSNPTLTLIALSIRIADELKRRYA